MRRFSKTIDLAVAFLYCSTLIAGSFFLQEPFAMAGSAAISMLLAGFLFGLSYIFFVHQASARLTVAGSILATFWWPASYTLIEASAYKELSLWIFIAVFSESLLVPKVLFMSLSTLVPTTVGVFLGLFLRNALGRTS